MATRENVKLWVLLIAGVVGLVIFIVKMIERGR